MKQEHVSFRTGAERAAMLTGWAGAVALISATAADGALVASNGATLSRTVVQTPGVGASVAQSVGIQLNDNVASGLWGTGTGGVDIAFLFDAAGEVRVGADAYYGYIQLAADGSTTGATRPLLQKFTSPDSVASMAVAFMDVTDTGVLFKTGTGAAGYWAGQSGYIGFRLGTSAIGPWSYGWVSISVDGALTAVNISHWSPDAIPGTTQEHMPSGSGTPEPAAAGLGLLALGAAGVLRHKRRRKTEAA